MAAFGSRPDCDLMTHRTKQTTKLVVPMSQYSTKSLQCQAPGQFRTIQIQLVDSAGMEPREFKIRTRTGTLPVASAPHANHASSAILSLTPASPAGCKLSLDL